jgi:hypothetical protein
MKLAKSFKTKEERRKKIFNVKRIAKLRERWKKWKKKLQI